MRVALHINKTQQHLGTSDRVRSQKAAAGCYGLKMLSIEKLMSETKVKIKVTANDTFRASRQTEITAVS